MNNEIAGFIFKNRDFDTFQDFLRDLKKDVLKIAQQQVDKNLVYMATFLHDCDIVKPDSGIKNYYNHVIDSFIHELEEASLDPTVTHPFNFGFVIYYKLLDFGYLCEIKAIPNRQILDYLFNIKNENVEWCNYSESLLSSPEFEEKEKMQQHKLLWEKNLPNDVQEEFSSFIMLMPNKLYISSDTVLAGLIPDLEERLEILARDIDIQTYIDNNKLDNTDNRIFMYASSVNHKNRLAGLKAQFRPMLENVVVTLDTLKKDRV